MLKARDKNAKSVTVEIDGEAFEVAAGITAAAAVLSTTDAATRTTPVTGAGRAPYCMMGVCFECLMEIDGVPNRQACMITVEAGMKIARQLGARDVGGGS